MNNYLIEASDHLLVQNKINEIINQEGFLNQYQAVYDLDEVLLSDALEDLDTYSFLSDKKIIIIKNILSSLVTEGEKEHLIKYIENYNPNNLLIICADKLDAKSFSKKLKGFKNISYQKLEINSTSFIKNKLKGYTISNLDISYLVDLCKDDITKINSECEKLMMYKYDSKQITRDDISNLVVKKLGDGNEILFSLVNSIMNKDKKNSLKLYQELKEYQIDNNSIIGLMASQMKLISQIKVLKEDGLSNVEIQETLKLKSLYQVKKLGEYINKYTFVEIGDFLKELSFLDYKIKTGRVDNFSAIELLIINL